MDDGPERHQDERSMLERFRVGTNANEDKDNHCGECGCMSGQTIQNKSDLLPTCEGDVRCEIPGFQCHRVSLESAVVWE